MENVSFRARHGLSPHLIHYSQIIQDNPQDAWACLNLSLHLQQMGLLEEARRSLHRTLSLAPDFALAHRTLAEICTQLNLTEEAGREIYSAKLMERRAWGRAEARKKQRDGLTSLLQKELPFRRIRL